MAAKIERLTPRAIGHVTPEETFSTTINGFVIRNDNPRLPSRGYVLALDSRDGTTAEARVSYTPQRRWAHGPIVAWAITIEKVEWEGDASFARDIVVGDERSLPAAMNAAAQALAAEQRRVVTLRRRAVAS